MALDSFTLVTCWCPFHQGHLFCHHIKESSSKTWRSIIHYMMMKIFNHTKSLYYITMLEILLSVRMIWAMTFHLDPCSHGVAHKALRVVQDGNTTATTTTKNMNNNSLNIISRNSVRNNCSGRKFWQGVFGILGLVFIAPSAWFYFSKSLERKRSATSFVELLMFSLGAFLLVVSLLSGIASCIRSGQNRRPPDFVRLGHEERREAVLQWITVHNVIITHHHGHFEFGEEYLSSSHGCAEDQPPPEYPALNLSNILLPPPPDYETAIQMSKLWL